MRHLSVLFVLAALASCTSSLQKREDALRSMRENVTVIPFDSMVCWLNDSMIVDTACRQSKYKLVVYVDSAVCSTCYLNEMYQWKDFTEMEESQFFSICFIFAPPSRNKNSIQNHFFRTELNHPIYVDTSYCFLDKNPHIPSEHVYHTFLLDKDNKATLVGNPLHNNKIEKMLKTILNNEAQSAIPAERACRH